MVGEKGDEIDPVRTSFSASIGWVLPGGCSQVWLCMAVLCCLVAIKVLAAISCAPATAPE